MSNFRKIEIKAFTKDEAIAQAPFAILKDATQAWKNAGKPVLTGLNEFMAEYLKKQTKTAPGIGCILVLDSGTADSREKPFKVNDVTNEVITGKALRLNKETGEKEEVDTTKRKFTTTYVIVDDETNAILHKSRETKAEAKKALADIYASGYKGNITCYYTKEVTEGEPRAFTAEYTPSVSTKLGAYLVFGVEA
jgi:hypothetical protein